MRYFDDVVCELHALKRHGLSPNTCARAINKSLEKEKEPSRNVNHKEHSSVQLLHQTTYPILVDDIYNCHQLASMGSKRDVGNAADLDKAFEHLKNR